MTEFSPIALYAILSLAVAVVSLVAAFYREAATTNTLLDETRHLLSTSAGLGIAAWVHLAAYLFYQLSHFASEHTEADIFNQAVHFLIVVTFIYVFARLGFFWMRKQSSLYIMRRQ
ncbi:MAG: hypothetical protein OXC18_06985 [Desulfurellaceae bacterium]|nr:hypothetical protein [Desulfurellaceae bacterium]